ncbi:MAG: hypothetical protein COU11_01520 [Candidatus Harrisonbacteria bacterium CG10_big_fil_rev_8_21_14_0_10_49_15]|uniref:FAD/NAD(P)-binding domain-containing protein n=1 Tax=Candidatus Harrisonbacteria bacterium CG10_big_fil_rev_8_21_14_0_10_49_15 TaxID=1974587 RepID=A0A2H0ULC5_9BACT|nr:MAG: hypothetical protein COU11_01520 [Candidatus Harrisonbacteria bacterium CG10_big_fil_rev_8_21_14_0_10_49_15]
MTTKRSEIVIVGAGFGGLRATVLLARGLRRLGCSAQYKIQLVEAHSYHTYTPTLYEVATTAQQAASMRGLRDVVTVSLKELVGSLPVEVVVGRVESVEVDEKKLRLDSGEALNYEYVVLAPGAQVNDFGIVGISEYAFPLKTFTDAVRLREKITMLSEGWSGKEFKVVIGGAGPTGVELAGELSQWLCPESEMLPKTCRAAITLVDGAPTVLPGFVPAVVARAQRRLDELGVAGEYGSFISEVTESDVRLINGATVPYDLFVWTGGIKQPEILKNSGFAKDERGAVLVDEQMQLGIPALDERMRSHAYGVGDAVCFVDSVSGKMAPATATAALDQAAVAAANILEEIAFATHKKTRPAFVSYQLRDYPYVIPIGGKFAIAKVRSFVFAGFGGWLLKLLVEFKYLVSIMSFARAVVIWTKGVRVYVKND